MSNHIIKTAIVIVIISLSILCGLLVKINIQLNKSLDGLSREKEGEFASKLAREKQLIRNDLDQQYAANILSYNAAAKKLEIEKKKVKKLEENSKKTINATH